jgi:hypothetical protein
MLKIDGFDDAIIGPALVWKEHQRVDLLVYDGEEMRSILMLRDGMDSDEAREYIAFNIEDAYMGEDTPIIVWREDQWRLDE